VNIVNKRRGRREEHEEEVSTSYLHLTSRFRTGKTCVSNLIDFNISCVGRRGFQDVHFNLLTL